MFYSLVYFCIYPVFHWGDTAKKMLSKVGVLVKICKGQSVDIEELSIEGVQIFCMLWDILGNIYQL